MEKKKSAFMERLGRALKSRVVRNLTIFGLLILSVFCMFLLDEGNYVRNKYMSSLSTNFISDLLDTLNVKRYNIGLEPWLIFFAIAGVVSVFLIASMFAEGYVANRVEAKKDKFNTENGARRYFTAQFYIIVLLLSAIFVFIYVKAGGLGRYRSHANGVFLDLIYTLLLCLLFIACGIVIISFAAIIIRAILGFISLLATGFIKNAKEDEKVEGGEEGVADAPVVSGKDLFPALTAIDVANAKEEETAEETVAEPTEVVALEELALRFQAYAAVNHKIYYELPLVRSFIAGLASSRLLILEGLSGTGKSMMPRVFSSFVGGAANFSSVQATWRDKSDVLGFYSEFAKTFKTTDFLRDLYAASYSENTALMVLDEMNISRIEYYFADFLSVLEYPQDQWKVKVHEVEQGQTLPAKLTDGYVSVPANAWFVGTANTDDSTFTITDKVYDRAITINFKERIEPIEPAYESDAITLTAEKMQEMFEEAKANEENALTDADKKKFFRVCDFIKEAFDVNFGNRIMVQIEQFVPVYVALGGTKEAALDFMLASKVLRKLDGIFEDYIKEELVALTKLLNSTYGKGTFAETERVIAKILKRLV